MEWTGDDGCTQHAVECCGLFDGKLSVRYDGKEVALLPNRLLLTPEDIERAIVAVILSLDNEEAQVAAKEAYDETVRDLSKW